MSRQARALVVLAVLVVSLGGVAAAPASAHPRLPAPPVVDLTAPADTLAAAVATAAGDEAPRARAPGDASWLGATGALALALIALRVRRRALVAGLGLLIGVLAVETGVHSVHHLDDAQAATACVIAVVTAQVHGAVGEPPAIEDARLAVPVGSVPAPASEQPGPRPRRPDEGRAPPTA
jgi:hypothetical protein